MLRAFIGALLLIVSLVVPAFGAEANINNPFQWGKLLSGWTVKFVMWSFDQLPAQAPALLIIKDLPQGAILKIDGANAIATHDQPFSASPGEHQIEVTNTGDTFEATVKMFAGNTVIVRYWVEREKNKELSRTDWGLVFIGGGAVLIGGGAVFGYLSEKQMAEAEKYSIRPEKKKYKRAVSLGLPFQGTANGLFIGGAALAGFGIYRALTNGSAPPKATEAGIEFTPTPNGVILQGIW